MCVSVFLEAHTDRVRQEGWKRRKKKMTAKNFPNAPKSHLIVSSKNDAVGCRYGPHSVTSTGLSFRGAHSNSKVNFAA